MSPAIDGAVIWRYMGFPKFVWLLATKSLWFAKAAELGDDPYEGFCAEAQYRDYPSVDTDRGRQSLTSPREMSHEEFFSRMGRYSAQVCMNARDYIYVNSWCLAPESMAMWRIYGSLEDGVAIKSSSGQYQRAARFEFPSQYHLGPVKYHEDLESCREVRRDFSERVQLGSELWKEILQLAFHKRACYDHEREWRAAVYKDAAPNARGIQVDFDLDLLVSAVYVSPRAASFFLRTVEATMDKFGLRKPVERSALLALPRTRSSGSATQG